MLINKECSLPTVTLLLGGGALDSLQVWSTIFLILNLFLEHLPFTLIANSKFQMHLVQTRSYQTNRKTKQQQKQRQNSGKNAILTAWVVLRISVNSNEFTLTLHCGPHMACQCILSVFISLFQERGRRMCAYSFLFSNKHHG